MDPQNKLKKRMDIRMPEMDGYDATLLIRKMKDEKKCNIPIIALTADINESVITKCNQIGMNDYITKPFDATILYKVMMKYLAHH